MPDRPNGRSVPRKPHAPNCRSTRAEPPRAGPLAVGRHDEPVRAGAGMSALLGAAALVASGRYVLFHAGAEVGEERWSVEPLAGGGAVARGEQVLRVPHPLPSELEWRARLSPEGRVESLEADWRVGTRQLRAEHAAGDGRWRARIAYGGHTREQEGEFPALAELVFGSHVLHTVMFRRYALEPGAEHEFPALVVGPPWFAADPARQRLLCTDVGTREVAGRSSRVRRIELRDPQGAVPAFAAWLDEHDVVVESYEDTHMDEPWMRLVEYRRG